jgi:PAS domain S-box-containing protein
MRLQARSWRSASSALLPFATAALAIAICIADILTGVEVTLAVLYVVVVLMATRFCGLPGVVLFAAGCIGLTVLSYFLSGESAVNTVVSIAAIGVATFLALQSQSAQARLIEQASLLDLTHDVVVTRTMDDVITYWNRGAEDLYGWHRADAVGKVAHDLLGTSGAVPLDQARVELLRTGRFEGEFVNKRRDGTPVQVTSRWSLQRDRHGRPSMIMVTSNDITERKRAEQALGESEEQWREVFEHNPVMYFMVSPTATVLSVNGFGAAQLGYTAAELIGQTVLNLFFQEDRKLVKDQLASCVEELGRPHSWEIRKIRKDGTVLWVRENAKAVQRSGNDAIILIACEDITERRRAERRRDGLYAVTRLLAEADNLAAAAPHILRAIGENLEWDWGALWSFDRERAQQGAPLRCDSLWHGSDIETAEFATATRERGYASGEGRLGQVWRAPRQSGWSMRRPTPSSCALRPRQNRGCMEPSFFRSCSIPKPSGSSSSSAALLANATKSNSPHCRRSAARSASSSSADEPKQHCARARSAGAGCSRRRPREWLWRSSAACLPRRTRRCGECSAEPRRRSSGTTSWSSITRRNAQQPRKRWRNSGAAH